MKQLILFMGPNGSMLILEIGWEGGIPGCHPCMHPPLLVTLYENLKKSEVLTLLVFSNRASLLKYGFLRH